MIERNANEGAMPIIRLCFFNFIIVLRHYVKQSTISNDGHGAHDPESGLKEMTTEKMY